MTARGPAQLPNLIIAGVAKGGTTSLFRYLAQHPDICASKIKELAYFEAVGYGEPLPPIESYSQHFDHCSGQRYRMEATPGYCHGGRRVASAVHGTLDDARVIICLREPVQRCWSWYRFVRSRARIPKDMSFSSYLSTSEQLYSAGLDGLRANQAYAGLRGSCYDEWIDAWVDLFGERLRIEFFDHLVSDPRGTVEGILGWLGVDVDAAAEFEYEIENRTVQYRSRPVQRAALHINRRGEPFFARHGKIKRALRTAYYMVNKDPAPEVLEPAAHERLAAFYAPHNDRLADALRRAGHDRWPAWLADAAT